MAALRKLKGKWYIRVRLPNSREKLIGTGTGDEREAKRLMKMVQEKEFMVKAKLVEEFELEPLTLREAKDRFKAYCKRKNLREETIRSYTSSLENLFLVIRPSASVRTLNKQVLQKLQDNLSDRDLKESSININLRSVRAFINWLHREKLIPEKIDIDFLKEDRNLPKLLLPDELDKIYAKCTDDKMRATFKVYEFLGLRLSELHQCVRDGDFVRVTAENAKGRKERIIPLPLEIEDDFELATTNPYKAMHITKTFTKLRVKAKIVAGKTLHSLRHTFAVRMLLQTDNIELVKNLLGHSDLKTTEIYLKFPPEYLKSVLTEKMSTKVLTPPAEA